MTTTSESNVGEAMMFLGCANKARSQVVQARQDEFKFKNLVQATCGWCFCSWYVQVMLQV
jgi:hypothetical protein